VKRALGVSAEHNLKAALKLLVTRMPDLAPERSLDAKRGMRSTPASGEEGSAG
jgi:hypothetical protein